MQIPNEPDFDFFFTSEDLYLLAKGLTHFIDCDCATIQQLIDCFPLLEKIELLNNQGLDDMAKSWNEKGVDE